MGLTAGLVPPRVDAHVKAGLLELVDHAAEYGGWSIRRSAAALGLDHARVLRWQARAALDRLADARPGPAEAAHALLGWEREAVLKLAEQWAEVDRSHRKLAHRGSRLDLVHVSESSVLRVLTAAGVHLPERGARERREARPWPEWAELVPGVIWIYDFERHEAPGTEWRWKTATAALSQQGGEAGGSLIRETPGRVDSSPDNDGTHQYYRMVRVRLARREGAREEPAS